MYELKHSNAVEIAEKVRELYDTRRTQLAVGSTEVRIVPDERLNRFLVQGSRIDRETIDGLIRAFDTEEGTASKPQIVPVRFAEASDIAEVVREVFRSQMTRSTALQHGARSSALSRVTPEIAVDPATNSLIVMAPSPLLDEILKLIDQAWTRPPNKTPPAASRSSPCRRPTPHASTKPCNASSNPAPPRPPSPPLTSPSPIPPACPADRSKERERRGTGALSEGHSLRCRLRNHVAVTARSRSQSTCRRCPRTVPVQADHVERLL